MPTDQIILPSTVPVAIRPRIARQHGIASGARFAALCAGSAVASIRDVLAIARATGFPPDEVAAALAARVRDRLARLDSDAVALGR